uniref:Uncharacterized protein n=1 Tax=Knipowitschia caucasica TaxID=637954 RepID=A0AAV2MIE8_KNICA
MTPHPHMWATFPLWSSRAGATCLQRHGDRCVASDMCSCSRIFQAQSVRPKSSTQTTTCSTNRGTVTMVTELSRDVIGSAFCLLTSGENVRRQLHVLIIDPSYNQEAFCLSSDCPQE